MHCSILKEPIYDVLDCPFLFHWDDFASMQGLPCYKKYGFRSWSNLPHQSPISVLNTYPKDYSLSAPHTVPTNDNSVLSFNLHSIDRIDIWADMVADKYDYYFCNFIKIIAPLIEHVW